MCGGQGSGVWRPTWGRFDSWCGRGGAFRCRGWFVTAGGAGSDRIRFGTGGHPPEPTHTCRDPTEGCRPKAGDPTTLLTVRGTRRVIQPPATSTSTRPTTPSTATSNSINPDFHHRQRHNNRHQQPPLFPPRNATRSTGRGDGAVWAALAGFVVERAFAFRASRLRHVQRGVYACSGHGNCDARVALDEGWRWAA